MSHSRSIPERAPVSSFPVECQYYEERTALVDVAWYAAPDLPGMPTDPAAAVDFWLDCGWRHFGSQFFRQRCPDCRACRSLRIPLATFRPSRSQQRVLDRNRDLDFRLVGPGDFLRHFAEAALALYNRFGSSRFGKAPESMENFLETFLESSVDTRASLLLREGRLVGCGFLDLGRESVSTIYYAFDPLEARRSPGTCSVLAEIAWARAAGYRHYHLGYWIPGHPRMDYKAAFRPHELLDPADGSWRGPDGLL